MKKILAIIVCCLIMSSCFTTTASAQNYPIEPFYNNVLSRTTTFDIDAAGNAIIVTSYDGQKGLTTGATIKIKLQKKFLFFFWSDVVSWTDETTGYYYSNTHSTIVDKGDYRAQVEYIIYGTGGSPDVVTDELERSY